VFDGIDPGYGPKYTHGSENNIFPEVWFWYPSKGSSAPDKYVIYNYAEGWWSIGSMDRTAAYGAGVFPYPITADSANDLYYQESGWTAAGVEIGTDRYVTTGAVNISDGNSLVHVRQAITDSGYGYNSTQLQMITSFTPEGAQTTHGPYQPRVDGYTDMRATGREFRLKVESTQDAEWSIGQIRLNITTGGQR
jgi:hypothetical protein